jgi:radical SAM/SPASM domain protein of ACGX system
MHPLPGLPDQGGDTFRFTVCFWQGNYGYMANSFVFQWHITEQCDQRCRHCYVFNAEKTRIPLKEVSEDAASRVLENCIDMCRTVGREPYFYLTGGDPLLHSRFWDIVGMLKSQEIAFSILGNPFHLSEQVCERLKRMGCERYQLSIDGLRETHDSIRMAGSFDATTQKVPVLRGAGIRCAVMTTVSKLNLHEIPKIVDLVVRHQVDIFAFARFCPNGFDPRTHVTPVEYRALLEQCWTRFEMYKDSGTCFNLKDHLWTLFQYEQGLFTIPQGLDGEQIYDGCQCGDCHLTILPNGAVYACRRFESAVGNALEGRLADIFTGEPMDEYRDFDRFEKCKRCELLRFCRGCPAVTYGYTKNMYAADPQCWKSVA